MHKIFFRSIVSILFVAGSASAQHQETGGHEDVFLHAFEAHMGVPDAPNDISLRLTPYRVRNAGQSHGDFAVHLEAGLARNLGLHIRSDGIQKHDYSEIMLQYAVFMDNERRNGVSLLAELAIPTGPIDDGDYKGLFGLSGRLTYSDLVRWEGSFHYDPDEEETGFENALIFRANDTFYPILEFRGHIDKGNEVEAYIMPALKFPYQGHSAIGFAIQVPVTDHKEYDTQALMTYDIGF